MRGLLGVALAVMLGCSHDARPAARADDHPPLPPSSGTPIGYLIDDATELHLRDEQVTELKAIDVDLAAHLDVLDAKLRGPGQAPVAAAEPPAGRHRGGRHGGGGRRGGGAPGAPGAPGAGGAAAAKPSPSRSAADDVNRLTEERRTDVRVAVERAFAMFDRAQQQIARRVLSDHGVDLDAGSEAAPAELAPTEPDTGHDGN